MLRGCINASSQGPHRPQEPQQPQQTQQPQRPQSTKGPVVTEGRRPWAPSRPNPLPTTTTDIPETELPFDELPLDFQTIQPNNNNQSPQGEIISILTEVYLGFQIRMKPSRLYHRVMRRAVMVFFVASQFHMVFRTRTIHFFSILISS